MAINSYNGFNMPYYRQYNPGFRAGNAPAPNFKAEESVFTSENPIETISQKIDEEKKKKHNKVAIATTSTVVGVSLLVALLNPKVSGKLVKYLKTAQEKANANIEKSKDSFLKSNFYKIYSKILGGGAKAGNFINNCNSLKDTYFKLLCTEEKSFIGKRDGSRSKWKTADKWFRKIFKKPHEKITQWADWLAQKTVRFKYGGATKKLDKLDLILKEYRSKLKPSEQKLFDEKIKELASRRGYFSEEQLAGRFKKQESLMENLNEKIRNKFTEYKNGFNSFNSNKKEHLNNSLSFWAEDLLKPQQEQVQQEGTAAVDRLFGKEGSKGVYQELLELVSPYASKEEKAILEKAIRKGEKELRSANLSECKSYFEKKRDLTLGSAPTDVVTALGGLGLAGIGFAAADTKDEKISKSITSVAPAVAGIGTNIALTSALVSGSLSLVLAGIASTFLSLFGSGIDHYRLKAKSKLLAEEEQNINNNVEVKNA